MERFNWFENNPRKTLAAAAGFGILLCAAVLAFVYYELRTAPLEEESILNAAFTYRTTVSPYHHGFKKNQAVDTATWGNRVYRLRTNSLGFKDAAVRDVPLESDRYRIVFIGDSFTEGLGMPYQDTFVGIIDRALRQSGAAALNAAAVSYSPIIYWRKTKYLLEEVGLDFDELVVFLDISDVQDEARSYYLDGRNRVKNRVMDDKNIKKKVINRIRKQKAVNAYDKLLYILSDFWPYPAGEAGLWTIDEAVFEKFGRAGLKQMTDYMDRLRELLQAHKIKMRVAVYPWPIQIRAGDVESIQAVYWQNWCQKHGIAFINYFPVFCAKNAEEEPREIIDQYFIAGDAHLNRAGHRLVARVFLNKFQPHSSPE